MCIDKKCRSTICHFAEMAYSPHSPLANAECRCTICHFASAKWHIRRIRLWRMQSVVVPSVVVPFAISLKWHIRRICLWQMQSVVVPSGVMLNVVVTSVVAPSVIMLNVVVPFAISLQRNGISAAFAYGKCRASLYRVS